MFFAMGISESKLKLFNVYLKYYSFNQINDKFNLSQLHIICK